MGDTIEVKYVDTHVNDIKLILSRSNQTCDPYIKPFGEEDYITVTKYVLDTFPTPSPHYPTAFPKQSFFSFLAEPVTHHSLEAQTVVTIVEEIVQVIDVLSPLIQ
jgi:hypothetical protein